MSPTDDCLHLARFQIPIESAVLTAVIPDPAWCDKFNNGQGKEIGWTLEIVTPMDHDIDRQPYAPILTTGSLNCPSRNWQDFDGAEISWTQLKNAVTGEYNGTLHINEHDYIKRSMLKFLSRDRNRFRIQWDGLGDIHWQEPNDKDVEFSLTTTATFSGVIVSGNAKESGETFRDRLDLYLEAGDFEQSEVLIAEADLERGFKRFMPRIFSRANRPASCTFYPK